MKLEERKMRFGAILVASILLASCSVFGLPEKRTSVFDQNIRGDCNSVMEAYQKALIERSNAAREFDYARYSGGANGNIEDLELKYRNAQNDVVSFEREIIPMACSKGSFKIH